MCIIIVIFGKVNDSCHNTLMLDKSELEALRIGDKVDLQDGVLRFLPAEVISKNHNRIMFHFIGWKINYDIELDCTNPNPRITHHLTKSIHSGPRLDYIKTRYFIKVFFKESHILPFGDDSEIPVMIRLKKKRFVENNGCRNLFI